MDGFGKVVGVGTTAWATVAQPAGDAAPTRLRTSVVSNIISLDGSQIIPAGVSHKSHLDSLPQSAINGPRELR